MGDLATRVICECVKATTVATSSKCCIYMLNVCFTKRPCCVAKEHDVSPSWNSKCSILSKLYLTEIATGGLYSWKRASYRWWQTKRQIVCFFLSMLIQYKKFKFQHILHFYMPCVCVNLLCVHACVCACVGLLLATYQIVFSFATFLTMKKV